MLTPDDPWEQIATCARIIRELRHRAIEMLNDADSLEGRKEQTVVISTAETMQRASNAIEDALGDDANRPIRYLFAAERREP